MREYQTNSTMDSLNSNFSMALDAETPLQSTGICPINSTHFNGNNTLSPLWVVYEKYFNVHGYVSVCVCLFGMLANSANIIVLTRKNMITSTTNYILLFLAIADLLTMLDYFPYAMHFYILKEPDLSFPQTRGFGWLCFLLFHASFSIVCHTIAIWLTISLAIFRFICIWFPARGSTYCTLREAKIAIFLIIICTVIICIPNYMCNEILQLSDCNGTEFKGYIYSVHVSESVVSKMNYWVQAVLIKLIPCFMLTLLTILLITAMHRAYKKRMALKNQGRREDSDRHGEQTRTTLMLLAVVVLFLITELPQGILTIISSFVENFFSDVYMPLGDFIDIMTLCNNAINFVLYCSMSKQFRQTFIKIFCDCCPKRRSGWRKMGVVGQKNGVSTFTNTTHV